MWWTLIRMANEKSASLIILVTWRVSWSGSSCWLTTAWICWRTVSVPFSQSIKMKETMINSNLLLTVSANLKDSLV
jgi:hypothetical protein